MLQNDVSCDHILHTTLKMPNFTTFFEILSELPVRRSDDHQINIFQISAKNASIWGITWIIYLWFFSSALWQWEMWKCFWPYHVIHQPINKKGGISPISHSTLSDKRIKAKNSNHYLPNETRKKFLTFCHFPDLLIEFCENQCICPLPYCIRIPENSSKWVFWILVLNGTRKTFFGRL